MGATDAQLLNSTIFRFALLVLMTLVWFALLILMASVWGVLLHSYKITPLFEGLRFWF